MDDPENRKPQWGGRRLGAGRPRRSDPRYRPSKCKTAENRQYGNPIADPTVEAEATLEQIIAKIKYLIADMPFFKSTDTHKLEFQLAMLFRPPGGYMPKWPTDVVGIRTSNPPLTRKILIVEARSYRG